MSLPIGPPSSLPGESSRRGHLVAPDIALLGLFQALLATALLIAPHWFMAPSYREWARHPLPVGATLLLAGTLLVWIAVLPVRSRPVVVAGFALAALNFGVLAVVFFRDHAIHATIVYCLLALGTLVIGWRLCRRTPGPGPRVRGDRPLARTIFIISLLTGVLMLARPNEYDGPLYDGMRSRLDLYGVAFVGLGALLLAHHLVGRGRWDRTRYAGELVLCGVVALWGVGFMERQVWTGVMAYALLGLGVVDVTPIRRWAERGHRRRFLAGGALRRRTVLLAATTLVGTAVAITLALTAGREADARADAEADAAVLAISAAENLRLFLDPHLQVVGQVAGLPSIQTMDPTRATTVLRQSLEAFPDFTNLSLVDDNGRQIARATEGPLADLSAKPYIQQALGGEPLVFGGVTDSVTTGEPIVVMAASVRDPTTGAVIGVVSASIRLPDIGAFLGDLAAARNHTILIIEERTILVAHRDPAVPGQDVALLAALPSDTGETGTGSTTFDVAGGRYLLGYAEVASYGWSVVVQQPEAFALAAVWRQQDRAYLVLIGIALLLVSGAVLLAHLLLEPIAALVGPIRAYGAGRYDVELPPGGDDEVGDVIHAVARMRGDLQEREVALQASEARFRSLVEHAFDVVVVLDLRGTVEFVSPAVERVLGFQPDDFEGGRILDLIHADDRERFGAAYVEALASPGGRVAMELRIRHLDGTWRWIETITQNRVDDPSVAGVVVTFRDVTERKAAEAVLAHQATHDALTGLANRVLFADRLEQTLRSASRRGETAAVLMLDLDRFKWVNDTLGHEVGDHFLVAVGRRLTACMRAGDTLARLGGDEFALVLENVTTETAQVAAGRILTSLAGPITVGGRDLYAAASIGIAVSTPDRSSPREMMRASDIALYRAKQAGRGIALTFDAADHTAQEWLDVETELRGAVDRDELVLHFQPIVALADGRTTMVEALVRWQHPTRGLMPPTSFLPVAEETGSITAITTWVVGEACRQLAAWQRTLGPSAPRVINVNVSSRDLRDLGLADRIPTALAAANLPASCLQLEINERVLVEELRAAMPTLHRLRALGVLLAIDDFGAGASSLASLQSVNADSLKLDRAFISSLAQEHTQVVVAALSAMAHALGMRVTAEGIETAEQLERARAAGCDQGQGYLFARPVTADDLATWLVRQAASPVKGTELCITAAA